MRGVGAMVARPPLPPRLARREKPNRWDEVKRAGTLGHSSVVEGWGSDPLSTPIPRRVRTGIAGGGGE